eukprot:7759211-Pyramimonas_sp.AAC.1
MMKREPSSHYLRGYLLEPTQMKWRDIAASIQLRFVFRGNLDKRSVVDFGNQDFQDAVMHYLD